MAGKRIYSPPGFSSEDSQLWKRIAAAITPAVFKKKYHAVQIEQEEPLPAAQLEQAVDTEARKPQTVAQEESLSAESLAAAFTNASLPTPSSATNASTSLQAGDLRQMDGQLAKKLRAGKVMIDATLDLHGYREEQAHQLLQQYIIHAATQGQRCLLIVTGKGSRSEQQGGVLKNRLSVWLNEPAMRDRILAFTEAQPRDGGAGAFYVLLKRRR